MVSVPIRHSRQRLGSHKLREIHEHRKHLKQDTRCILYNILVHMVSALFYWSIGGGTLGIDNSPVCTYNQSWTSALHMYMYNCDSFPPSGTSLRARTFVPIVGWGGHNSTVGLTLPEVWSRSVQCVARGKRLKLFWPWAHLRQIPGFPQHPRGLGFCIPYPRIRA